MDHFQGNSDSKACLAWDMVDSLVMHPENVQAREGTSDAETGLENILGGLTMVGAPREAFHLDRWTKQIISDKYQECGSRHTMLLHHIQL